MFAEAPVAEGDPPAILLIDDDPLIAVVLRRAMQGLPHHLFTAEDGRAGLAELEARRPDLVILDNVLPDGLGIDTLSRIHELAPSVPVLFITAKGSGETAIRAMKQCAFDYLPKPLEPTRLRTQIDRALSLRRLLLSSKETPNQPIAVQGGEPRGGGDDDEADTLIGQCPAMQSVFKSIGRVTMQDVSVLIRGENGTGKEAVAREIHRHGRCSSGPLVKLHCRGLDDARLESQLFGAAASGQHEACSKIAEAEGGALLLQEVGALPLPLQAKLLRAVRDGVYETAGGEADQTVRCRLLTTTSEDLEEKTRAGEFRSDLYYVLSSFVISLPPLRQRHGDLPLLIERCLRKLTPIAQAFGVDSPSISDEALKVLCSHLWPGNLDELESVLKRVLVEQKGNVLLASDLVEAISGESLLAQGDAGPSTKHTIDWSRFADMRIEAGADTLHADAIAETERHVFDCVLQHTRGNQAHAARILGITRASLRKKLRMYGMAPRLKAD